MPSVLDRLRSGFSLASVPASKVLGTTGAVVVGGYLQDNEQAPELQGQQRYRTYSDILANVSIVAAGVRYFLNLVARANWKIEPPAGVPGADRYAELFESMLYDMKTPWSRVTRRTAGFKLHGFSIQEWTSKRRKDGFTGLYDVAPRPQVTIERWAVDPHGELAGVFQRAPESGEEIPLPRGKIVYAVDDALADTPEGLGLFRHFVEPAKRLREFQLLEAYGFQADLAGIPVAEVPLQVLNDAVKRGEIDDATRKAYLRPLRQFLEKRVKNPKLGLLIDSAPYRGTDDAQTPSSVKQWGVSLLDSNASASLVSNAAAIERINRELARLLGVEGLLLGTSGQGSHALSRDKSQSFGLTVDSVLAEEGLVYEADLVAPVWRLNGWPEEAKPTLKADVSSFRDVEAVAKTLSDMATAGAILDPDDPVIGEVRDLLGVSRPPEVSAEDSDAALRREEDDGDRGDLAGGVVPGGPGPGAGPEPAEE